MGCGLAVANVGHHTSMSRSCGASVGSGRSVGLCVGRDSVL